MARQFLTTSEAGKRLGVSRMRVVHFINEGRLKAEKIGRDWLIDPKDLKTVQDRKPGRPRKDRSDLA